MGQILIKIPIPFILPKGTFKIPCGAKIIAHSKTNYGSTIHISCTREAQLCDAEFIHVVEHEEIPDGYNYIGQNDKGLLFIKHC